MDEPSAELRRAHEVDMLVADNVRRRRVSLGLSLKDVAYMLNIAYQQLHKIENGKNRISAVRLHQLSLFFGCSIDEFYVSCHKEAAGSFTSRRRLNMLRQFEKIPDDLHRATIIGICRLLAEASVARRAAISQPDRPACT